MTKYYYNKYRTNKEYQETAPQYATETAEDVGEDGFALVLVHDRYDFSSYTGKFSGRGKSDKIFYKVLGDPDYPRYYVTPTWIMHIDSAKESGGVVKISGRKINNRAVWLRGQLYAEDIVAEDGTYPNNGRHTDGYWYVKGGLAFPEFKMRIGGVLKTSENGWVKINGQLREIDTIWTKINGALREVE